MNQRSFLISQKLEAERLLELAGDHPLMAPPLRKRLASIEAELQNNPPVEVVNTVLYFTGAPVRGSFGINADFVARVLSPFTDMVKTQYCALKNGRVGTRGLRRGEHEATLLLTNLPRGSFGLELTPPPHQADLFQGAQLGQAMRMMTQLVQSAAQNDDAFVGILNDAPKRVLPDLERFLAAIVEDNAALRLVTGDLEVALSQAAAVQALERARGATTEDEIIEQPGVFRGATLDSGRFDFTSATGDLIRGNVDEDVTDEFLGEINRRFTNSECIASLRVIRITTRSGTTRKRFELLSLREPAK